MNMKHQHRISSSLFVVGSLLAVSCVLARAASWKPLPDTGQSLCYDQSGKEIPCPPAGQPLSGQDAQYHGVKAVFQDNDDLTISDQKSGRIWMKTDDGVGRPWQEAIDYCESLELAGHNDWRLPGKFELESIVDYGRAYPALDPVFKCQASFYWSNLPYTDDPIYAWGVLFNDGGDHWLDKKNHYFVRCVRGGN